MVALHPKYITDNTGEKMVMLPVAEFNTIVNELEELEDIKLYDEAKQEDGTRILFADYVKQRRERNA